MSALWNKKSSWRTVFIRIFKRRRYGRQYPYKGGEVCNPTSWFKHPKPLFVKGNGIYGVGHASFFYSPDGSELWCAYHCLLRTNPECTEMDRHTCVQKIDFDENDYPVMGLPVGIENEISSPSGEEK